MWRLPERFPTLQSPSRFRFLLFFTEMMFLWSVEDNATNEFMQLFYQHLLKGESKVQALRAAQCSLLYQTGSIYTHPYFWAAFRLVGDVGPLKYARADYSFASATQPIKK